MLLHAHLPFVRSVEHDRFLEENWFFEACTETYIPILQMLDRVCEKGIPGSIVLSVSPTLAHMLRDPLLNKRYQLHLQKSLELASQEIERFEGDPVRQPLASFYRERLFAIQQAFAVRYNRDILGALLRHFRAGRVELVSCVGTHPFLPAYQSDPATVDFQLACTQAACKDWLGAVPKTVWLPECGYFEGLDSLLQKRGFTGIFMETHGVLLARPSPRYGVFEAVTTPAGVRALGRDQASSREVWSRTAGYPGHPEYREFFRDLCREVPREYLGDYYYAGDCPIETGFKYYRITGGETKELYRPWAALHLAREHARMFVENREKQILDLSPHMEVPPVIFAPYDAELFGHWWFEGPDFLEALFEHVARSPILSLEAAGGLLQSANPLQCTPSFSSWGEGGYGSVWINAEVDWIYPLFFGIVTQFRALLRSLRRPTPLQRRILSQMARELALLQASDWAFMIHNKSAEGYARSRVQEHHDNFVELRRLLVGGSLRTEILEKLEEQNNIFPWMSVEQFGVLS